MFSLVTAKCTAETVLAMLLQARGTVGGRSEPAAGTGPTSGPASQPQSQGRQRITLLLEAWTQQWRATQLPKLQANAYRCGSQIVPVFDLLSNYTQELFGHPASISAAWPAQSKCIQD